ncbi:contact-dependent growth inhibition system immunity protein [Afifella marina]|nr:contact-dependent growth inhibition system immunity protein [Afifella marina]MBK1622708.1 DUF1436 domain-containing protein [Afifella marina DSM 2698]MBK1625703.1 DUF1436 domain-containing protein [Afifella marina]MBK5917526.1 hypothetical protein [Afifella marina]RAI23460.1 hypothetical protein CH311_00835 [Afifella marina DSM 2698]
MSHERAVLQLRARFSRDREPEPPPPKPRKQATVEAYRAFTRIYSHAVYGAAYPDPAGYDQIHTARMPDSDLGYEARSALRASRFVAPEHPDWDSVIRIPTDDELREEEERDKKRAGVRSLRALYAGAGSVSLQLRDGEITIEAERHRGHGHWEGIPGIKPTILPESVSDEVLGAAVNAALEVSRNA